MKTLDEVIDAMERCSIPHYFDCKGCPYEDDDAEVGCQSDDRDADALNYLKEYREKHDDILRMEEALGYCEIMANPPLTWDELKSMEGKPVWVEHIYYKKWLIVKDVYEETIVLDGNGFYTQYFSDDNEKETRWQAYRKERE